MNAVRAFEHLAKSNRFCGALCGAVALAGLIAALALESRSQGFIGMVAFIIGGLMTGSLVHSASRHLQRPSRDSALAIASNTAFFLWFSLALILGFSPLRDYLGSKHILVGPAVAFLTHCLILQPLALGAPLPRDTWDSTLGRLLGGIFRLGKVLAIFGFTLFWMWTSTFGPSWPGITEPAKLRREATLLCQGEPGEVPREKWPEGIAALKPRDVIASRESVNVRISGGGMSGRPWGFVIWPDTAKQSDRGITRHESESAP